MSTNTKRALRWDPPGFQYPDQHVVGSGARPIGMDRVGAEAEPDRGSISTVVAVPLIRTLGVIFLDCFNQNGIIADNVESRVTVANSVPEKVGTHGPSAVLGRVNGHHA